jgi:hypothetical protein
MYSKITGCSFRKTISGASFTARLQKLSFLSIYFQKIYPVIHHGLNFCAVALDYAKQLEGTTAILSNNQEETDTNDYDALFSEYQNTEYIQGDAVMEKRFSF